MVAPQFSPALLSRIEDAGLNASTPPQQRWVDGWLLRTSPGKAKRARCIQPVADGRLPLQQRLAVCERAFRAAGLPMVARITPFSRPPGLDAALAALGWYRLDDTRVMVAAPCPSAMPALPAGLVWQMMEAADYAEMIGTMRGSPTAQRLAHAQRLLASPVPYQGWVLRRAGTGQVLACAQSAAEDDLVGLYDVFTLAAERGQGLSRLLCGLVLGQAYLQGAEVAYLQVDADNAPARAVYHGLGFVDAYAYHYRSPHRDAG